jgi:hypothetical protein
MALAQGVNAYSTVVDADAYFANRLDVAAWVEATNPQKEQALVTATFYLEELRWVGVVISEAQPLAFPRAGSYFDPRIGYSVDLPTTVPDRVIRAQFELAYHILNNDGLLDDTGTVDTLNLGTITLNKIRNPQKIPPAVHHIIRPLIINSVRSWWRAN